jgi:radical SAM superfamily enzyme YgiQ (UPF0313 family)
MTPNEAKKQVRQWLKDHGLPEYKLSAKTVDFSDLARVRVIFVTVHDWQPHPGIPFRDLEVWAKRQGFEAQTEGNYSG